MIPLAVPAADGNGARKDWPGGWADVYCYGTFNGGTVTLKATPDDGTTNFTVKDTDGVDVTFAANGMKQIALGSGVKIFASLTGSGGSTSVTLQIARGMAVTAAF